MPDNDFRPSSIGLDRRLASSRSKAELFDIIVETAPEGIIIAAGDGRILSFSSAAERIFGWREADVIGQNLSILMPANHAELHDRYMARYQETGERQVIGQGRDVIALRRDGTSFAAHLEVGELREEDDHLFVGFIRDKTEENAANAKARRLERLLAQTGRAQVVGEMSTALAHELSQPLTAISNFAKAAALILEEDDGDLSKAHSYVERVADLSLRSGDIVRKMRGLVERGKVNLKPDDINAIVEEAVHVSETGEDDRTVEVCLDLARDLPLVLADRIQVQQVVINLLRNAREAVEGVEGRNALTEQRIATDMLPMRDRIEMTATVNDDECVVVTVSDTGPGIPADMLTAIFDPMVTSKPDGVGVGLAICRSIIHAHGGQIWAENNPDGGTNVHFTLRTADNA
ncbi:MAG: PAS domain S-box protein [Pseudomonadota bacterium]